MNRIRVTLALFATMIIVPLAHAAISAAALQKTDIIFAGAVQRDAPAMADLPEGTRAINVKVERVLEKPSAIVLRVGDTVTVSVDDPAAYPPDSHHTFYTAGWIFGETLAVREIAHEDVPALTAAATQQASVGEAMRDAKMQSAVSSADAVIVGRVVRITKPENLTASASGASDELREHDPEWRDAEVEVTNWVKGSSTAKRAIVRFPASMDVMWYRVPKLRVGMQRTWMLHNDNGFAAAAPLTGVAGAPHFILLLPTDEQPAADAPRARRAFAATR